MNIFNHNSILTNIGQENTTIGIKPASFIAVFSNEHNFKRMKKLIWKKKTTLPVVSQKMPSLASCLLMDFLGYATYAIPFFGEFLDILWAPISAFIFFRMFGGVKGFFGGAFNFFEELMPGLDFIPTFTITWLLQYFCRPKPVQNMQVITTR
jgi:hypothetical protein